MHVWEAQKVRLDLWDETDSGTVPRPVLSAVFDNEQAAEAAILDWSEGMTKNEPTFEMPNIRGWKVREENILWGYAIHKRDVMSEHAAKERGGRARRKKGESTPQLPEKVDVKHSDDQLGTQSSEVQLDPPVDPA